MAGLHDGYQRLREPVRHARTIVVMHGLYWLFVDCIEGSGEHLVEQRFHVVPGAQVAGRQDGSGVDVTKDGASLSLSWAQEGAATPRKPKAAAPEIRIEPSLAEFYSGRPEPSWIVTAECRERVPVALAVVASSAGRDVRVRWGGATERPRWLVVTGRGFEHQVYAGCGMDRLPPLPGGWRTDAHFAIIRQFAEAELRDVLLPGASRVWRHNHEYPAVTGEPGGAGGMRRLLLELAR